MPAPLQFVVLVALSLLATTAHALDVRNARAPEPPQGAPVMAGYMELHNYTDETITVTGASSPVFERVEIHRTIMEDDSARMEPLDELAVEPGQPEYLVPQGTHLMLFAPEDGIAVGDELPVRLETTDGEVEIELQVKSAMMFDHDDAEHAE